MSNWRTTLFGAIVALGTYFSTLDGAFKLIGQILIGAGTFFLGATAADAKKQ